MDLTLWIGFFVLLVGIYFSKIFIKKYGPFSNRRFLIDGVVVFLAWGIGFSVEGFIFGCFKDWSGMCGYLTILIAAGVIFLWFIFTLLWTTIRFLKFKKGQIDLKK